jgi:dTMP kinase
MYIVFEGIDGSGKTSLIESLFNDEELAKRFNIKIKKEPFNRKFIEESFKKMKNLNDKNKAILLTLAFAYDRVFLEEEFSKFYNNSLVLSDRSFISSLAYQSLFLELKWVYCVNKHFKKPDLVIYLDVDVEEALKRINLRNEKNIDYFEKKEFLEKLKISYNKVLNFLKEKGIKVFIVNANEPFDVVKSKVKQIILENLK